MSHNPHDPSVKETPREQADEDHGQIKNRQVTDRNMAEKDLPRGSENETRRRG